MKSATEFNREQTGDTCMSPVRVFAIAAEGCQPGNGRKRDAGPMRFQIPTKREKQTFYPVDLPLRYIVENRLAGSGRTIELSSEIARLTCDQPLAVGQGIELCIAWPAFLPGGTLLNLWISGTILAPLLDEVTVRIRRYEFKTRPRVQAMLVARPSADAVARVGR